MGIFENLIKTVVDVVVIPLDVIQDIAELPEGKILQNTRKKVGTLAQDGANIIKDTVNLDL